MPRRIMRSLTAKGREGAEQVRNGVRKLRGVSGLTGH